MEQRELKFRALRDDMADCTWRYGNLLYDEHNNPRIQEVNGDMFYTTCLKGTEGQYTGLKDRTGKEIWEGDIVKMDPREYGDDSSARVVQWVNGGFLESMWSVGDLRSWVDVIGNIYENPDLLK